MTRNQKIARGIVAVLVLTFMGFVTWVSVGGGYPWWFGLAVVLGSLVLTAMLYAFIDWMARNW